MRLKTTFCLGAIGLVVPLWALHQESDAPAANRSHLKQAALSLLMYANDYDDSLPYAQSTGAVISVTEPYLKNFTMWWPVNGGRFLFSSALAGVPMTAIAEPANTVMIYGDHLEADGTKDVAFSDGHVKSRSADAWSTDEKTLHLKMARTGKPLPTSLGAQYNTDRVPAAK